MSHVIGEQCLGEVYAACTEVCPVDCIHPGVFEGSKFMVIDPEVCIDCGVCLPECPVAAIVASPQENPEWAAINANAAPEFKKTTPVDRSEIPKRPKNDPPINPDNKLIAG